MTGEFLVLDAEDGEVLFQFNTGAPNNGGAAIYAIGGTQYVALMSGNTSSIWATPPGGRNRDRVRTTIRTPRRNGC